MIIQIKKFLLTTIFSYSLLSTTLHLVAESSTTDPFKFIYASTIGTGGYTINNPGYYVLVEDVAFEPTGACSAITTATNNVTINLNDHSIYQNNSQATVVGITINTGLYDVTIKNGTLSGFTDYGIYVNNNCNNLAIENININKSTCTSAMRFVGTSGNIVYDCTIKNCNVTEITSGQYCIYFNYCNNIKIINSTFNDNIRTSGEFNVIYPDNSNNFLFTTCQFNNNKTSDGALNIVNINNSNSFILDSCIISQNSSTAQDFTGILLKCSDNNIIKDCTLDQNSATSSEAIDLCSSVITSSGTANIIDSCIITKNSSTTNTENAFTRGILISDASYALKNIVRNCLVTNNSASATALNKNAMCSGIEILHGTYHFVDNCETLYNTATATGGGTADANGYGIYNTTANTTIRNCSSFGNSQYGIYNTADSIVVGCTAGYNGAAGAGNYGGAATPQSDPVTKLGDNATVMEKFGNTNINA